MLITLRAQRVKIEAFGTGIKCPSKSNAHLIQSQRRGVKKGRDQLCQRLAFVKTELTVWGQMQSGWEVEWQTQSNHIRVHALLTLND